MSEVEGQDRVGVLVFSVRRAAPCGGLVVQLTAIDRLGAERRAIKLPADADAVVARVLQWLTATAGGQPLDWPLDW